MPPPPPELLEDLVEETLLRIPPDDPALLVRASLVCKSWRRLLTDPAFLLRYRAFHRIPPLLGFFRHWCSFQVEFFPAPSFRPRNTHRDDCFRLRDAPRSNCHMLDCRHGRALLCSLSEFSSSSGFIVWDPITGDERHVPVGTDIYYDRGVDFAKGAVLCALRDCDHGDCRGGPFFVVLVNTNYEDVEDDEDGVWFSQACVYSSVTGEWAALDYSSNGFKDQFRIDQLPAALVGLTGHRRVLYFSCERGAVVLRYENTGDLLMINGPSEDIEGAVLTPGVEGGLRCAALMPESDRLVLWSLEAMDADGVAGWTQVAVIHLNTLPPIVASTGLPYLIGSAKDRDSNVFFVSTDFDIFAIEVESRKTKKVWENVDGRGYSLIYDFFPYTSFLTPDRSVGRLSFPMETL